MSKSGLKRQFKNDVKKVVEGTRVPFEDAINDNGTVPTFILAYAGTGNKAYRKMLKAETHPHRKTIDAGKMNDEEADAIMKRVFVSTILRGWENVLDDATGEPISFSRENALALLNEEGMEPLFERLQEEAGLETNFREATLALEAGN